MKNITVSISDTAYLRARVWTAEHGSSLSSVVAYLLETLPKIECAKNYYPLHTKRPSAGAGKPLTAQDSHCSSPREPCPPPPGTPSPPPLHSQKIDCETVVPPTHAGSAACSQNPASPQKP
jgi:hypothetical protein